MSKAVSTDADLMTAKESGCNDLEKSPRCVYIAFQIDEALRGSIPSFFMREIKVVRLIPMRAAAP